MTNQNHPDDRAIEHDRADEPVDDNTYFVMRNAGGAVFVKHGPFFVSLGGLTVSEGLLRRLARPADRYDEVFTLDRHEAAEELRALLSKQE